MSLSIHAEPTGRGTSAVVTARLDGEVLAVERLDLAKSKERSRFIAELRTRLGSAADEMLDAAGVERDLAAAAAELAAPPSVPEADSFDAGEIGDGRVARPEAFILADVSGLTVPRRIVRGDEVVSEWVTLLRWRDGRREAAPLPKTLTSGGQRVFVSPKPPAPPPNASPGWSSEGRKAWLAGEPAMPRDELARMLMESLARYLDFPSGEMAAGTVAMLCCWIILSYVFHAFDSVPYLAVSGPAGSGKSRVFELLAQLVFRPLSTSNVSNAALFRHLDAFGGAVLIDEAERLRESRDPAVGELLSSLLAGYRRNGSVTRCEAVGDGFEMKHFSVFGLKAVACINSIPTALASRCIPVAMFRSPPDSPKPRLRVEQDAERWAMLRDALHAVALEHGEDWLSLPARQDVCPPMSGRHFELWQPMLAIAAWLEDGGAKGLLSILQRHALSTIESGIEDATPPDDELLLRILAAAVRRGDKLTASELLAEAQQADTAMFRGWSAKAVSAHLKRYAIRSRKTGGRPIFDPRPDELARVQASYSIDLDMPTAVPPPENVPHVPYVPREPKARPDLGHVGHVGVRSQEGIPDAF
jgi:hypothetical protein